MYCIDKNDHHLFHVCIGSGKKIRTLCERTAGKILKQPPDNLVLCDECYNAANPSLRQSRALEMAHRRSPLVIPFRSKVLKTPKPTKPLPEQAPLFPE